MRYALRCIVPGLATMLIMGVLGCGDNKSPNLVSQPMETNLGSVDISSSCSGQVQRDLNHSVALLHHMTYAQARDGFRRVAEADSQCALAHWGIAMTLFQPLWPTRPGLEERNQGWEEVLKARKIAPQTERERLFIRAAEAFFIDPDSSDYWQRIRRWEEGMQTVYSAFPDDPEAATFYALSHLATERADTISRVHADRAAQILLDAHGRYPDHPGALHYMVHANDVPGRESESLDIVEQYENIAPQNPHALHMPTHIYTRLGDWDGVIRGNLKAAEAALAHSAGDHGEFISDEYPHAIEYLVYAYLQRGADAEAEAWMNRLHETASLQPSFKTAFHLASTQARYVLERHAWEEAANLAPREPSAVNWDLFAWPEAVSWFAVGIGAIHEGNTEKVHQVLKRLGELETSTTRTGEVLFARNIKILRLEVTSWLAHKEGDRETSIAMMREAANLEASTPKHAVTPGPTIPAYEQLGDLLIDEQPEEALSSYEHALSQYPNRFNSILGAARAAGALGDSLKVHTLYQQLMRVSVKNARPSSMEEVRQLIQK